MSVSSADSGVPKPPAAAEPAAVDAAGPDPFDLTPPVQLLVRCRACGHERVWPALNASVLAEARYCERCRGENQVLAYRLMHGGNCACCLL